MIPTPAVHWRWRVLLGLLLLLALSSMASGCVTLKPWEKSALMRRCMQRSGEPLAAAMETHVNRTREAIGGAEATGGVSCGCN